MAPDLVEKKKEKKGWVNREALSTQVDEDRTGKDKQGGPIGSPQGPLWGAHTDLTFNINSC